MNRRFEARKHQMLAECEVSPELLREVLPRLAEFLAPFARCLCVAAQQQHTEEYCQGLLSNLKRKNVESIAYQHDQVRRNLQHFIGTAEWDHAPLMDEENLNAAVALHVAHYNFCRIHGTLGKTPAMAAGVTNDIWTLADLYEKALA